MSARDDGGPAFPVPVGLAAELGCVPSASDAGMTLRDYFAARAMQAVATNPTGAESFTFDERAKWAYQQADAMLRAREAV